MAFLRVTGLKKTLYYQFYADNFWYNAAFQRHAKLCMPVPKTDSLEKIP